MDNNGNAKENEYYYDDDDAKSYALRGKIMLITILILFIVVIFMLCLHVYVRWRLGSPRRPPRRNNIPSRRPHFVFYFDPSVTAPSRGLDASVIAALPFFAFSHKTHTDPIDCPVCLSEFEEGETGRVLPKCNHTFHTDCIDMWFKSHSTCPLCRAPVDPPTRPELVLNVCDPEPGSSSGSCSRKPSSIVDVSIEVAGRNEGFGDGSGRDSPSSIRSSMSRVLSLKRILSRERRSSVSASSGCAVGCSSAAELDDVERGGREETR